MTTITFDNHSFIKKLVKSGVKIEQAEIIAGGLKESRELDLNQLVTKDFLKAENGQMKFDLLKWMFAIGFILLGSFVGGLFTLYYFLKPFIAIVS